MALDGRTLTVECPCAGTPHESDLVIFREVLPMKGGIAGMKAMADALREAQEEDRTLIDTDLAVALFPVFLDWAIESWTFVRDGEPLPVGKEADGVLPFGTKYEIADAADDLFGEEITRPLAVMMRRSSRGTATGPSTSRRPSSGRSPRRRSGSSSPATSEDSPPSTP